MSRKIKFVQQAHELNKKIVAIMDEVGDLSSAYYDNGFDGAGDDPIVDDDLVDRELGADDVVNFVTLIDQLNKFFQNEAVTTGDYSVTANVMRYAQF